MLPLRPYVTDMDRLLTDSEIFKGILKSWEWEDPPSLKAMSYMLPFSEEKIKTIKKKTQ